MGEGDKELLERLDEGLNRLKAASEAISHPAWKAIVDLLDAEIDDAVNRISNGEKVEHMSGRLYALRRIANMWKYVGTQTHILQIERAKASKAVGEGRGRS